MTSPDAPISEWITSLACNSTFADRIMNLLACDFFMPVVLSLFMLYMWFGTSDPAQRIKNQYGAMCASASLGFGNLGVHIINRVLDIDLWPRPFEIDEGARQAAETVLYLPKDPSFPANMAAATFAAAIGMFFYRRKASIPLFAISIVWSFARVYAGVHYPLDILGGMAIGVIMAFFSYGLMRLLWPLPKIAFWFGRKLYAA